MNLEAQGLGRELAGIHRQNVFPAVEVLINYYQRVYLLLFNRESFLLWCTPSLSQLKTILSHGHI